MELLQREEPLGFAEGGVRWAEGGLHGASTLGSLGESGGWQALPLPNTVLCSERTLPRRLRWLRAHAVFGS